MYVHCMYAWSLQKPEAALDTPELELRMVMRHHVGAGTKPGPSVRAENALLH